MEFSSLRSVAREVAPYGGLTLVELITTSYMILSEVIFVQGTSSTVFLFYQFMVSTLFMAPLAFIFERKSVPLLTWKIIGRIFLLALIGITFSIIMKSTALYFITSAVSSSVRNTTVVITYSLALITRQEKLQFHTLWGYGKLLGTLLSVSGALALILWHRSVTDLATDSTNWAIGLVMLIAGVVSSSIWFLMLEPVTRSYPAKLSMTTIMMLFATIQTGLVAAVASHSVSQWQLNWDLELLNILIGGILYNGLCNFIYAWCAGSKNPVFLSSFTPLGTLFTTLAGIGLLGHGITFGSVIGSILIVMGLYMYLWSKSKEEAREKVDNEIITSLLVQNQHPDYKV